jgi:oligosaccharide translocation protein RFT1
MRAGHCTPAAADLQREARLLTVLVRFITTVALLAAAFGPAYAYLALLLLYSRRWADTEAPLALGLYSLYLVLVASNGILESFVHSVADEQQLHANNAALVVFTAAHAALSIAAVRTMGACGLILSDSLNMVLRIIFCVVLIKRRFELTAPSFRPRNLLPSRHTLMALTAAAAITCMTRMMLLPSSSTLVHLLRGQSIRLVPPALVPFLDAQPFYMLVSGHLAVGVACFTLVVTAIFYNEGGIMQEVKRLQQL